jgi:hypothetical protein
MSYQDSIKVGGVVMSYEAARNTEQFGDPAAMVAEDLAALRDGTHTPKSLLAHCLHGAEQGDVVEAWRDYVDALVAHLDTRKGE